MLVEAQCLWRFNDCGGSMIVEVQCLWRFNACGGSMLVEGGSMLVEV